MKQRTFVALTSIATLTTCIAIFAFWWAQRSNTALEALNRRVVGLSQNLSTASAKIDNLSNDRPPPTVVRLEAAPVEQPRLQAPTPVQAETAHADPPSAEDQRAYVQATFAQQPVDPVWASNATSQAKGIFNSLTSESTSVRSIDCRSSLCRVELAQGKADEAVRVANELATHGKLGWQGGISAAVEKTNPDGSISYVLYLARDVMPNLE